MNRVVIISDNLNERAALAAQLKEETYCVVAGAASLREAMLLLMLPTDLVILDSAAIEKSRRTQLVAALRGAPILILVGQSDKKTMGAFALGNSQIMDRPFTVGDVVKQAGVLLRDTKNG